VPFSIPRHVVTEFYEAFVAACTVRDLDRIAPFLHNDVEWIITGPVDVLSFCGTRRGKAAVLDLIARAGPAVLRVKDFARDELLVDGDRVAALIRVTGERRGTGAAISYRIAQFMRFHLHQVIQFHAVIDSFDAAEQVLGRPLDLGPRVQRNGAATDDLVRL
jgi:ketosteroid isomerase-like protein